MTIAAHAFEERFGTAPTHEARAPGRVNLIGEHTDYNDLAVLPIALQREAVIALRPRDDGRVILHDTAPEFESIDFEISPAIPRDVEGHWSNYVRGPATKLARRFAIWRGFEGVLHSSVPVAAGLSSSSALVTAVGLALAHLNEVPVEERAFAELMAESERFTGTMGGGMDQAVSLAARPGHAVLMTFGPLRLTHVPVPSDWRFVVADTGVRAEKSGAAQRTYNLRRTECHEALTSVLTEVERAGLARRTPSGYPELIRALGTDQTMAVAERALDGGLLKRFRHVVSEAARVDQAVDLLRSAEIAGFGTLMDASHGSLRSDFLVSSAELDELVAVAREGGAYGARLTGAGLGGSIVAVTDVPGVEAVLETLISEYYEPRGLTERLGDRAFVAVPSGGAAFTDLA